MSETEIWLRDEESGRLEREVFGYTPFADVPESPYYIPSPGSWLSARAWVDEDGRHVVVAHDCATERRVHTMRWPTWQAVNSQVDPSYDCGDCGFHSRVPIAWAEVPAPAPAGDSGGERG